MIVQMLTGVVPVGIARCPQCGRDVYLASADHDEHAYGIGVEQVLTPTAPGPIEPTPAPYLLAHHASRWPYAGWEEHRWGADAFELRRVFAMELAPRKGAQG